jgi:hypothetical protein
MYYGLEERRDVVKCRVVAVRTSERMRSEAHNESGMIGRREKGANEVSKREIS